MAFEPNVLKSVTLALLAIEAARAMPPSPVACHNDTVQETKLKKPYVNPNEHECPACNGTGFPDVAQLRPGFRTYPVQCKECLGKGRISVSDN
jgi:DnaJ-class molecular chaperone